MDCMRDCVMKGTRLVTVYETVTLYILIKVQFGFQYGMSSATIANLRHVVEVFVVFFATVQGWRMFRSRLHRHVHGIA